MGIMSLNDVHPVTARVKEVNRTHFKFQMQEYSYLDKTHKIEKISYMVVEQGSWRLKDGSWIEAGRKVMGSGW